MREFWLVFPLFALPAVFSALLWLMTSARSVLLVQAAGSALSAVFALAAAIFTLWNKTPVVFAGGWFMVDVLSAWHIVVMSLVFLFSSVYSVSYFRTDLQENRFSKGAARRFGALWLGSQAAMHLVLVSNNIGLMWVGIESTTLLTAFLICTHTTAASLEAMWKYLLMCSVGVALAFMGTLLLAAATHGVLHGADALLWTHLVKEAPRLHPQLVKIAFLFLVVGYGTKAGLAPMHNWLPDAHSQAPSPVSAVFSGFLLNAAFYGILRILPVAQAVSPGWAQEILVVLGLAGILIAAVFIVSQHDVKRLLAYSSVEHMGILALGVGVGGLGVPVAMFHMLNNSLGKTAGFLSAGAVGRIFGTYDMRKIRRMAHVSPVWGVALAASLLALVGTAPFALFMSEYLMLHAAIQSGRILVAVLFLAGLVLAFVGTLRHVMALTWDPPPADATDFPAGGKPARPALWEAALVFLPLFALLVLGVFIPGRLWEVFSSAARIVGGF